MTVRDLQTALRGLEGSTVLGQLPDGQRCFLQEAVDIAGEETVVILQLAERPPE